MNSTELYQLMLAYQQKHEFTEEEQSNFLIVLEKLRVKQTSLDE